LFAWQVATDAFGDFARANVLDTMTRRSLIMAMLAGAAVTGLASAFYASLSTQRAVRLHRTALILSPLVLIGVVPPILNASIWPDALSVAMAIAVFTLLFERLLRVSLETMDSGPSVAEHTRARRRRALVVVILAALFYAGYMGMYTVFAHLRFQTYNFDLGQYDNVFWNWLHGRPLVCTPLGADKPWSSFSSHADLGIFFLLPIYAIYPHAETLLVLQSLLLGLGAIPLYLFAVRRIPPWSACALVICYLLYPPMHGSNFYDFHFQPVAGTFVLLVIWAVDSKRWVWLTISFILAISCREDIAVGLTILGLYLLLARYRPRAGLLMAVVAATYFVVIRFVIMPSHGQGWFSDIYKDLYPQPTGPFSFGGVIQTLITNPTYVFRTLLTAEKLKYFVQIAAPLAFLPLRRAYLLPALIPGAISTLLTTGYGPTTDIAFQYSGHFTPYVFTASAVALAASRGFRPFVFRSSVAALVVGTFLCTHQWGAFPPSGRLKGGFSIISFAWPTAADLRKRRDLAQLAAMIPEEASFAVSEQELPHVSGRLKVMTLRDGAGGAEYVLYGIGSGGSHIATQLLAGGDYVMVAERPAVALLKRR
jgi:uncharacterized membrane protein